MRKSINIFLAVLITLFSIPLNGLNVQAAEKVYDDIEDGEYTLTAKLLKEGTNEKSAAADFMSNEVTLAIQDGEAQLTFFIPNNDMMNFNNFLVEDVEANITDGKNEDETGKYYTFGIGILKAKLSSKVSYEVPMMNLIHNNVGMDIQLIGLDNLPKIEEEEVTPEEPEENDKPDQGNDSDKDETEKPEEDPKDDVTSLKDLDDGYYTVNASHMHDEKEEASAMARYLADTVFLSVKNGKAELTVTINDNNTVTKLQVASQNPIEKLVNENKNYETFKLNDLGETVSAYAEYQAPFGDAVHYGNADFRIVFDEASIKSAEESDKPGYGLEPEETEKEEPEENEKEEPEKGNNSEGNDEGVEEDTKILNPDKAYEINYTILNENKKDPSVANGFFEKPGILLEKDGKTYLQMTVESAEMVQALSNKYGDYVLVSEKDGKRTMQLRVPDNLSDMVLDMHIVVPAGAIPGFPGYNEKHGAILTFDKSSKKEVDAKKYQLVATNEKDNGNAPFDKDAKPTPNPTPNSESDNGNGQNVNNGKGASGEDEEVNLTPDKAYTINYTILNEENGKASVADGFFQKPGILLEYEGKTYLQMTVESAEMVKALSNKYGDYILVSKNADGTMTIQLRVPDDLSNMKLDMHIVVPAGAIPGFPGYNEKHGAILTFDKGSKKEISVEGLEVAASGDKNNENGPYVEGATPGKPSFGENDNENGNKKNGLNPKTGDTSQVFFFTMLLIGSLGVLAVQLRRRLAA